MAQLFSGRFFKRKIWIRSVVQIFFFVLVAVIAVNHTLAESGGGVAFLSSASVHAICPFGGVETLYQALTAGTLVAKTQPSALVLMGIVLFLSVLFGPVFCGWVCPFGTIQEWVGKLGRKLFRRRYNQFIPARLDAVLRYTRYLVLAWVVYMTAASATLIFADYDPYFALFHFWTGETALSGLILLGVFLLGSLFVERPWCKYACPYGAVLGLTNFFRIFQLRRTESTCKLDGACDITCPMNIKVSEQRIIRDPQCISCMECTSEARCPVAATVYMAAGSPRLPQPAARPVSK